MYKSFDLYQLVKTLSPNEKRYFKIFSRLHVKGNENQYIKLFETIDKLILKKEVSPLEINEDELKKTLKTIHFSRTKNYLYELILKSLQSFANKNNVESRINDLLNKVDVLIEKKMYEAGIKFLEKAGKIAVQYEQYALLLNIYKREKNLLIENTKITNVPKHYNKLIRDEKEAIENLTMLTEIKNHGLERIMLCSNLGSRTQQTVYNKLSKMMELSVIKKAVSQTTSVLITIRALDFINSCNMYMGNINEALISNKKLIQIFKQHKHFIDEYPGLYRKVITFDVELSLSLGKNTEAQKGIAILQTHRDKIGYLKNTLLSKRLELDCILSQLLLFKSKGEYSDAKKWLVNNIERWSAYQLQPDNIHIVNNQIIIFNYLIAQIYYGGGEIKQARKLLNILLNQLDRKQELRIDIILDIKIMLLLIGFDLGDFISIEYKLNNTLRNISKYKAFMIFEKYVLRMLKKIRNEMEISKIEKELRDLKSQILTIEASIHPYDKLMHFNYVAWINSKLSSISFETASKEKIVNI